jgi:zinc transport system substrate-binding protein
LSQVDGENAAVYQKAAEEYKAEVAAKEAEIKTKLAEVNVSGVNVLCADWQAGFVGWTGLNIVATYGAPESLTPQVVQDLVDKGREGKVTLIIDNLHSGRDAGKAIAEELGSQRIILSNFPGGLENTETWEQAIDRNIELILEAIAQ